MSQFNYAKVINLHQDDCKCRNKIVLAHVFRIAPPGNGGEDAALSMNLFSNE